MANTFAEAVDLAQKTGWVKFPSNIEDEFSLESSSMIAACAAKDCRIVYLEVKSNSETMEPYLNSIDVSLTYEKKDNAQPFAIQCSKIPYVKFPLTQIGLPRFRPRGFRVLEEHECLKGAMKPMKLEVKSSSLKEERTTFPVLPLEDQSHQLKEKLLGNEEAIAPIQEVSLSNLEQPLPPPPTESPQRNDEKVEEDEVLSNSVGSDSAVFRQKSLMQWLSSSSKHPREEASSPPQKGKRKKIDTLSKPACSLEKSAKETKKKKNISHTSMAKLAKASTKTATSKLNTHLLDEENDPFDEEANSQNEEIQLCLEGQAYDSPLELEEPQNFENDKIILCDEAPPAVFRQPEPKSAVAPSCSSESVSLSDSTNLKGKLDALFNPEIARFQKNFKREVKTDMKIENGEYICEEVVVYKSLIDGEIISRDEYFNRSAAVFAAALNKSP